MNQWLVAVNKPRCEERTIREEVFTMGVQPEPPVRMERDVFRAGMTYRPEKGKSKNRYSREEAGTVASAIVTRRFEGSRLTCVCKSRIY